jgi:hypothetical protein
MTAENLDGPPLRPVTKTLNRSTKIMFSATGLLLNTLTTGHANLRFFAFLHYSYERRMTQICVLKRAWFLRT